MKCANVMCYSKQMLQNGVSLIESGKEISVYPEKDGREERKSKSLVDIQEWEQRKRWF